MQREPPRHRTYLENSVINKKIPKAPYESTLVLKRKLATCDTQQNCLLLVRIGGYELVEFRDGAPCDCVNHAVNDVAEYVDRELA